MSVQPSLQPVPNEFVFELDGTVGGTECLFFVFIEVIILFKREMKTSKQSHLFVLLEVRHQGWPIKQNRKHRDSYVQLYIAPHNPAT